MKKDILPQKAKAKGIHSRVLRKEGFEKGYRGAELDLYAKGLPVPQRKKSGHAMF